MAHRVRREGFLTLRAASVSMAAHRSSRMARRYARRGWTRLIPITLSILVGLLSLVSHHGAPRSVSAEVVISQVYGGGGNSGATLKHDFIELFNRGVSSVDLTGWSVQYAPATGDAWQVT